MELKELTDKVMQLFGVDNTDDLSSAIYNSVIDNHTEIKHLFIELVQDLSIDWMQMIFQYYQADRKDKKQDYTPKSVAYLMACLAGESDKVVDMCAGSGALTIQRWNYNHKTRFELYEIDGRVIPYLLFNMWIRDVECVIYHADVLKNEIYSVYAIESGMARKVKKWQQ